EAGVEGGGGGGERGGLDVETRIFTDDRRHPEPELIGAPHAVRGYRGGRKVRPEQLGGRSDPLGELLTAAEEEDLEASAAFEISPPSVGSLRRQPRDAPC